MPTALHERAEENLRFIRTAMERASSVTAVSGWGGVVMGVTALVAAAIAWQQLTTQAWLLTWVTEAVVAVAIGLAAMALKSRRSGQPLLTAAFRQFALAFAPAAAAGALLTVSLPRAGATALLPGVWLLLYGAAVAAAGAFSVRAVPFMGLVLMALGAVALFTPAAAGDAFMAAGFGIVHIVFGIVIARKHGG